MINDNIKRQKQENERLSYKDILNDQIIIDEYSKIDKINKFHFNHGLRHVTNVTNIMNKLTDVIGVDGEQKDDLLIAAALHDIGQVENRQDHGPKGKLFAANYLDGKIKGIRLKKSYHL